MQYVVDTVEIKKRMAENQIDSIADLELITGVNRNTLSKVIRGKSYPSAHVIGGIAYSLHMTSEDIGRIFFCQKLK